MEANKTNFLGRWESYLKFPYLKNEVILIKKLLFEL